MAHDLVEDVSGNSGAAHLGPLSGRWVSVLFYPVKNPLGQVAGLISLPREPFLAAAIDGAGPIRTFFNVTFPLMAPVSIGAVMIRLIEASKLMETVYVLTSGGPGTATETSGYYIYIKGLRDFNIGYAASLSITYLVIMIVLLTVIGKVVHRAFIGGRS